MPRPLMFSSLLIIIWSNNENYLYVTRVARQIWGTRTKLSLCCCLCFVWSFPNLPICNLCRCVWVVCWVVCEQKVLCELVGGLKRDRMLPSKRNGGRDPWRQSSFWYAWLVLMLNGFRVGESVLLRTLRWWSWFSMPTPRTSEYFVVSRAVLWLLKSSRVHIWLSVYM